MNKKATVIIMPRDRFSGLLDCIETIYKYTPIGLFDLIVLDLGYPASIIKNANKLLQKYDNAKIVSYGLMIPIEGIAKIRGAIQTQYTVFMDNDSRATEGWLPPIIETADAKEAAIVYPVTLERSGVDEGADIRNHLFTTELRVVDVENEPYLIEHKSFRRADVCDLPNEVTESNAFELHCVMFNTSILNKLELPHLTIREHLDIGLQLNLMGQKLYVDPRSKIVFDNLGTRAQLRDLQYFNLRWNSKITYDSSRLFEKRWGYKFYSEESIYNWAMRRRIFLVLRWMYLPIKVANVIDRVFFSLRRKFFPIWDPIKDPEGQSKALYDELGGMPPKQLDHTI